MCQLVKDVVRVAAALRAAGARAHRVQLARNQTELGLFLSAWWAVLPCTSSTVQPIQLAAVHECLLHPLTAEVSETQSSGSIWEHLLRTCRCSVKNAVTLLGTMLASSTACTQFLVGFICLSTSFCTTKRKPISSEGAAAADRIISACQLLSPNWQGTQTPLSAGLGPGAAGPLDGLTNIRLLLRALPARFAACCQPAATMACAVEGLHRNLQVDCRQHTAGL